jgi:trehalose-6-phosphate synthase
LKYIRNEELNNFGIIISEYIGVSSAIKGAFRINPYNIANILNALERIFDMNLEERTNRYKKDLEHILKNTTYSWIKNFFIDLKRTNHVKINKNLFKYFILFYEKIYI